MEKAAVLYLGRVLQDKKETLEGFLSDDPNFNVLKPIADPEDFKAVGVEKAKKISERYNKAYRELIAAGLPAPSYRIAAGIKPEHDPGKKTPGQKGPKQ